VIDNANFQRAGALSNSHVGGEFEAIAAEVLREAGIVVVPSFAVEVGHPDRCKLHRFDFGYDDPALLVECKSHRWTVGGNSPSAKLTVWNEAMYYFALAPRHFRKIFFVLRDVRRGESLADYYIRRYAHLIPDDVEIWEFCVDARAVRLSFPHP
jgi:hypothetical protein